MFDLVPSCNKAFDFPTETLRKLRQNLFAQFSNIY